MNRSRTSAWRWLIAPTLIASALLSANALGAAEVEQNGALFATESSADGESLVLTGTGVARYRVIFTVYAAGLYLPEQTPENAILAPDTPRRLEIEYFHTIAASDIIKAANTKLETQLSAAELERLRPAIARFHALYQGVEAGDRYHMDYQPGRGTELRFNGKPVGRVGGGDFARAYFGIWLDKDDPLSPSLRDDLLANVSD